MSRLSPRHAEFFRTPAGTRAPDSRPGQFASSIGTPALPGSTALALWPPTSVLLETGRELDPGPLLEPILAQMDALWRTWEAGGLLELLASWSARDVSRGHRVRLLPDGPEGVAAGIDLTGALRVRLPDGRELLALAGELSFIGRRRRER
jgi:biotin-(acetyl-CoA carboxylase) ligase